MFTKNFFLAVTMGDPDVSPYPKYLADIMVVAWSFIFLGSYFIFVRLWRKIQSSNSVGYLTVILHVVLISMFVALIVWVLSRCLFVPPGWQVPWPLVGTLITACMFILAALYIIKAKRFRCIRLTATIVCFLTTSLCSPLGIGSVDILVLPLAVLLHYICLFYFLFIACLISSMIMLLINHRIWIMGLFR